MKRKRFTEEQIIAVLREHEAGAKAGDLARKHGISRRRCITGRRSMATYAEVLTATGSSAAQNEGSAPTPIAQPEPNGVTERVGTLIAAG